VEVEAEQLGSKYRLTVRFGEVPLPLSGKDIELVKPTSSAEEPKLIGGDSFQGRDTKPSPNTAKASFEA
jgi:hypothetical protein